MGVSSWLWWSEGVGEGALVSSPDLHRGSRGAPPQCLVLERQTQLIQTHRLGGGIKLRNNPFRASAGALNSAPSTSAGYESKPAPSTMNLK